MSIEQAKQQAPAVVFPDIDDVLCLNNVFGGFAAVEATKGRHPNPAAVFVADALHEGERWRTTVKLGRLRRVDEIAAWLDRFHRGEPFAIIDDIQSGASLLPALTLPDHPLVGRVVLCAENVGLNDEHVQTIVDALQRPAEAPGGMR